jgi:hypothetical protein
VCQSRKEKDIMDWEELVDHAGVYCLFMVFMLLLGFCFGILLSFLV